MGDRYLIASADPITFATDDLARYALAVNANDVAVRGARPRWFLATRLLPEGTTTEATATALLAQLVEACDELDIALVGGHTEFTHGSPAPHRGYHAGMWPYKLVTRAAEGVRCV